MAAKVEKNNKQEVKEEKNALAPVDVALIRLLQRFDMIQTYSDAISNKVNELYEDLIKCETGNPLTLMHIKTINQLLVNIDTQIKQATSTDLNPV